jgi:hypothetical protein
MNTEVEMHRSDFPGFPEEPFVLVARSLAIRARPRAVGAEVSGFASIPISLPFKLVRDQSLIGSEAEGMAADVDEVNRGRCTMTSIAATMRR